MFMEPRCLEQHDPQEPNYSESPNVPRLRNEDDVVYTYNGLLLSHQKEWYLTICNDLDRTRGYYAKRSKSVRKRQISLTWFINMGFKKQDRWTYGKEQKRRGESNHKRTRWGVMEGWGWGWARWGMGIKKMFWWAPGVLCKWWFTDLYSWN